MKAEAALESKACAYATKKGFHVRKFTSTSRSGVPDRIFFSPTGKTGLIEFKAPGEKPSPLQLYEIGELEKRHIPVIWTSCLTTAKAFIDSLL